MNKQTRKDYTFFINIKGYIELLAQKNGLSLIKVLKNIKKYNSFDISKLTLIIENINVVKNSVDELKRNMFIDIDRANEIITFLDEFRTKIEEELKNSSDEEKQIFLKRNVNKRRKNYIKQGGEEITWQQNEKHLPQEVQEEKQININEILKTEKARKVKLQRVEVKQKKK